MSLTQLLRQANKSWHGVKLGKPDWGSHSHSVAFSAELKNEGLVSYFILNAYWQALEFELPPIVHGKAQPWHRWIDTALDSPEDIVSWQSSSPVRGLTYRAESHSVVVLFADSKGQWDKDT